MIYSEKDLKSLKVEQLRQILADMQLETAGKKDELVKRISENEASLPADHVKLQP